MEFFLHPALAIFTGTLAAVAIVAVIELLLVAVAGAGFSDMFESVLHTDVLADSALAHWLQVKDVPVMVFLMSIAAGFGSTGLIIQGFATEVFSNPLPVWAAALLAAIASIGLTRILNRAFKKLKVTHTTALLPHEFPGRHVVLLSDVARQSLPGEAKFTDQHGQVHYLMVQPVDIADVFLQGEVLKLLEPHGAIYWAKRANSPE